MFHGKHNNSKKKLILIKKIVFLKRKSNSINAYYKQIIHNLNKKIYISSEINVSRETLFIKEHNVTFKY